MGRKHQPPTPVVTPTPVPPSPSTPPGTQTGSSAYQPIPGAPTCVSSDINHICIGLKIVSYERGGASVLSQAQAINLVNGINSVWAQCNIGFQLETFQQVDPTTEGLTYDSDWQSDGDTIRETFSDKSKFLVVTLGKLSGSTIGVTEMPGSGVYGSLIEDSYAQNALTVGHELGHYQGLYHVSSNQNLMYAYIGSHTATLTNAQCNTARSTDQASWRSMFRK